MAAPSKWVVICSPVSGKKQGQAICEKQLIPALKEKGVTNVELILTEYKAHAVELAREHGNKDTGIISVGGDGTLHECIDGLIASGKLGETWLGILSQGTMNFYAKSGGLPGPDGLAECIKNKTVRRSSLMRVEDHDAGGDKKGSVSTVCFEALYFGIGYMPAKGAQVYRTSALGPMFGIMSELIRSCISPSRAAVRGQLTLYPKGGGKPIVVADEFFWIIVTMRSPYNGALTDDLYVSYLKLDSFPGFGRMMDFFKPPMECLAGFASICDDNVCVDKVTWVQDGGKPIGVCLDGDPTDAAEGMTISLQEQAWNVVAPAYPAMTPAEHTSVGPLTKVGHAWLEKNPPPKGTALSPFKPYVEKKKSGWLLPVLGVVGIACLGMVAYKKWSDANSGAI